MKKNTKVIITITSVVIFVIAVVAITLGAITTKPFTNLADYEYAYIYQGSTDTSAQCLISSTTDATNKAKNTEFQNLLKDSRYSILQSLLSGRTNTANAYYTDSNNETVTLSVDDLKKEGNLGLYEVSSKITNFDTSIPKIKLVYSDEKTVVVGKDTTYTFDTIEFLVPNTQNEIREVIVIAYSQEDFQQNNSDDGDVTEKATTYGVFKIMANTTALNSFVTNF